MRQDSRLGRVSRQLRTAISGLFDQSQPFGRLAAVHTLFSAGTTLVAISLAGSLFFDVSPSQSKSKVLLYLLLTIAPFAVVAPALSPLLDRGLTARRASVAVACAGSALLALLMGNDLHGFLLFPEAFGILVLQKLYMVARAAIVPSMTEGDDDLASANAKLAVLAALAGFVVSPFGVAFLQLGAVWVLRLTCIVFAFGAVAAVRLPRSDTLPAPVKSLGEGQDGRPIHGPVPPPPLATPEPAGGRSGGPGALLYESRGQGASRRHRLDVKRERHRLGLPFIVPEVTVALSAMSVLRGTFGFLTFFLAFELRAMHAATWWYGVLLLASGVGGLLGSISVPTLRRYLSEQQLILACLVLTSALSFVVAFLGALWAQPLLTLVVGYSSTAAKPAFDSIGQRYVPPAALGRAFARFETQLQLVWVASALVAVIVSGIPFRAGDLVVGAACAIAALFHLSMRHSISRPGAPADGRAGLGSDGGARSGAPTTVRAGRRGHGRRIEGPATSPGPAAGAGSAFEP